MPRRLKSKEGWDVMIGRSNEGNDYLTHKLARPEDYWFHVHGAAGAHAGAGCREPAGLGEPRGDRGTGAARDEDSEDRRLHAREVVLQRITDANRGAPGHLPAAAGEVRRLVQREPGARREQCDPDGEDSAPAPGHDSCEPPE